MPLMPHHNHLCLTEGGLEIIISKLNRIKSAIELCVYAFSNFYRTAITKKELHSKEIGAQFISILSAACTGFFHGLVHFYNQKVGDAPEASGILDFDYFRTVFAVNDSVRIGRLVGKHLSLLGMGGD